METILGLLGDNIEVVVASFIAIILGLLRKLAKLTKNTNDDALVDYLGNPEVKEVIQKESVKLAKKILADKLAKAKERNKNK